MALVYMNLLEFQKNFGTEEQCLAYLEEAKWSKGRFCPHCKSDKTYKFTDGILFKCGACRKQFTVKVGTIFSDSKIPLYKWFLAIYLATSLKKGISSMQLSRYISVTQKSSWFMLQRIRYAIEKSGNGNLLENVVEVDETYIGGKHAGKRGRGALGKTPVVGIAQRQGTVRMEAVTNTTARTVRKIVRDNVRIGTYVLTDEYRSYNRLEQDGYTHGRIIHSAGEYANGEIHTNTIEGVWSHLKRGIDGVYHHVSPKHLQKYCKEYEYRYNTRTLKDFDRFTDSLTLTNQRLTYTQLTK